MVYRFVSHDSTRIPRQGFYRRPQSRHTFRRQQDGCYSNPEVRKTVRHENAPHEFQDLCNSQRPDDSRKPKPWGGHIQSTV